MKEAKLWKVVEDVRTAPVLESVPVCQGSFAIFPFMSGKIN